VNSIFSVSGVRGRVGDAPMDAATVKAIGRALAIMLWEGGVQPTVLVASDPRPSSSDVVRWLTDGIIAAGCCVKQAGVLPTPALAWAVSQCGACAGVMVTGSHNTQAVNGLKLFNQQGEALERRRIERLEALMAQPYSDDWTSGVVECVQGVYQRAYVQAVYDDAVYTPCVVDCAAGACAALTPFLPPLVQVVGQRGAINDGVGVMHPSHIQKVMRERDVPVGFAFDGDGDRVFACDPKGYVLDGADIIAMLAYHEHAPCVVLNEYTNEGLVVALQACGIVVHRCPVGDASVAQAMRCYQAPLGGEPSGHVLPGTTVGDGVRTMVRLLRLMDQTKKSVQELRLPWTPHPFRQATYAYTGAAPDLAVLQGIAQEARIDDSRVIVRASATEPVIRVYVEGVSDQAVGTMWEHVLVRMRQSIPMVVA